MRKKKIIITQEVIDQKINNIKEYILEIIPNINNIIFEYDKCIFNHKYIQQEGIKFNIKYLINNHYFPLFSFVYIINNKYLKEISQDEMLNRIVMIFYINFDILYEEEQVFVLNHISLIKDIDLKLLKKMQKACKGKAIYKINSLFLLYDLKDN